MLRERSTTLGAKMALLGQKLNYTYRKLGDLWHHSRHFSHRELVVMPVSH